MYIVLSDNDLFVGINYLESTLSAVSALNVAHVFGLAINEILTKSPLPVEQVDLLTQRDLDQIQRWNVNLPPKVDACVHDLVLQHAESSPQSPALCSWDGNLTYHQLDEISLRLAKYFLSAGIKAGTLVPICFRKSMYAVITMIAIHRAGGAFAPLDSSHPKDRLKTIIEKANAKLVVASPENADLFHGLGNTIIEISSSMIESLQPQPEHNVPKVRPDNAAFVLFTSGSTGKPKGIVQEHASVCTSSLAHGRAMDVTSESRVFQYAAFTFDVSMMDIFTTLIYGGCVCIPSEEDRMGSFTSVMNAMQVNWALFTPSVASLITPEEVPTLQNLALGGEALKQENVDRWTGKVKLFNCYGPAECAACSIGEITQQETRPGNIGRQFGGGLNWVLDPENHNRILPIGAIGELAIEGPTLARCYLDDLVKTKAAFIKSPSWPRVARSNRPRRLYKTGDLVRQNSDGTFDFIGRKDHQLKVRGQRVEIGEVEFHLSTFPGIALSVATMPQTGPYSNTLVALIQLRSENEGTQVHITDFDYVSNERLSMIGFVKEKLSHFLRSKLPSYMVPTHLLVVNKLPLSVSGKIDRRIVDSWLASTNRIYESKSTSNDHQEESLLAENVIAHEICFKILSLIAKPGTAFFNSLNGSNFSLSAVALDSIQVISLTMFIRQRFGVKVRLDTLVSPKATVQSVTDSIENALAGRQDPTAESQINLFETFRDYRKKAFEDFTITEGGVQNVLLTGATGFLGSRILYKLCLQDNIRRIILHVRDKTAEHALQRVVKSAKSAGWWTEKFLGKLEAWIGDLAKPKLGLASEQWRRLCGYGLPAERITAVIHNGAAVNWNASFPSLQAINVDSTVELVRAASQSAALTDFVYVSGGQRLKISEDDDMEIAEEVARSNGYAQSKFLSELIVKSYAQEMAPHQQKISIIKPGYIIGTPEEGIANIDDFIWRLTASCVDIKGYNAMDANSWLFISDVDRVAAAVSECCSPTELAQARAANIVKILDGMPVSRFWEILKHGLGYELHPLGSQLWVDRTCKRIEETGESHQLWPLLQIVEEGQGRIGAPCDLQGRVDMDEPRIQAAVKKNVEYLSSIGFLPMPDGGRKSGKDSIAVGFTRTPNVAVA